MERPERRERGDSVRITGPIDPRFTIVQRLAMSALPRAVTTLVETVPPPAAAMPLVLPQTSVAMLLAIAASDPEARRRRNVSEAARGLGALERMHEEIRIGRPNALRLREIAAWMDNHSVPDDPQAAGFLREVELRVLVELAKAERD
jgi:hypothetical protein